MKQLSFSFKTLMLVLSLLCANKQLYAQYDYIPLVEEGKVWNYGEDADLTSPTLYSYFIMGDTVIGGQEYKKMFKQTHDDGFIGFNGTTPSYFCYLKDHQGNIRSVLNSSGAVQEYNRYYPYGTTHGSQMYGNIQPYKYNGKELDRMHGLDLYDYGARYYDAAMARWTSMDPLCEQYYSISPYAYCLNNPVRFIDPHGKSVYMLFYTCGNGEESDSMFKTAAETRKKDIMKSKGFDPQKDIVVLKPISNLGHLASYVSEIVDNYSGTYGTTKEFGMWSHSGLNGPIGTTHFVTNAIDNYQFKDGVR